MHSAITILSATHSRAARVLKKISGRLAALESIDTAEYRSRVKRLFGKVLPPAQVVERILTDVRLRGDKAILAYARRIDGASLTRRTMRVSDSERRSAYQRTSRTIRLALVKSIERIGDYQRRLMPSDVSLAPARNGPSDVRTGLAWSPLRRVGLYVPAGTAPLFSSVAMNAVPALVAGVKEIVVTTPCDKSGVPSDSILCACEMLGLREIYKLGGAQAIGAMAFGTQSIEPVDKIAGPGNLFVMLAKRAVFGYVDIDMLAGPSEILVIADASANPAYIAADLLSQAEHDVLASCMLLTNSPVLAHAVSNELQRQLKTLPRKKIAEKALKNWGLILITKTIAQAVSLANEIAPEHLEIITQNAQDLARKLHTAGAIFIGPYATEPLGDYLAGPSHTLPTGGTARAFSGVSVYTFLRRTSLIEADSRGLRALADSVCTLADAEGLEGHRRAVLARTQSKAQ